MRLHQKPSPLRQNGRQFVLCCRLAHEASCRRVESSEVLTAGVSDRYSSTSLRPRGRPRWRARLCPWPRRPPLMWSSSIVSEFLSKTGRQLAVSFRGSQPAGRPAAGLQDTGVLGACIARPLDLCSSASTTGCTIRGASENAIGWPESGVGAGVSKTLLSLRLFCHVRVRLLSCVGRAPPSSGRVNCLP